MPNWCSNHITVRGTNQKEIAEIAKAMEEGRFCDSIIPTPEDLNITAGREGNDNDPKQIALVAKEQANLEKYGVRNWYDFQVNRWGTKWEVECQDVQVEDDGLTVSTYFDSAWSPPMGIVEELMNRGLQVTLYYYEPGMGFVGKYEDGCDDYYDLSGLDSSTVISAIGNELDDFFGISESMAEYEAENEEEELTEWLKEGVEARKEPQ